VNLKWLVDTYGKSWGVKENASSCDPRQVASQYHNLDISFQNKKNNSNMDAGERSRFEKQSLTLRGELKTWEKEFAAANEGRKATRDEIKQNASIGMFVPGYSNFLY